MTSSESMTGQSLPARDWAAPRYKPCVKTRGPRQAQILLLGEAPGEQEETFGVPFVGSSGKELSRMLSEAGLREQSLRMTNVFATRPPNNQLTAFFVPTKGHPKDAPSSPFPPLRLDNRAHFLHPALTPEWARLQAEIEETAPNLILALGNTALWRLTGRTSVSSLRGTCLLSEPSLTGQAIKVLPTYHPAAVLRQWPLRPIVVADLMKAGRQALFPEIRRPRRLLLVNPTLQDLETFLRERLPQARALAVDVETRRGQITEIALATGPEFSLVVPFIRGLGANYWPTASEEAQTLRLVRAILQSPIPKIFQNGLYDLQYIWRTWGFAPCMPPGSADTMIRHHSLLPEAQKGLGFLGSLYTEEPAWKLMRRQKHDTEFKRDDE